VELEDGSVEDSAEKIRLTVLSELDDD